jgi:hypothetical protein
LAQLNQFERAGTHRLIPSRFGGGSDLDSLALSAQVVADLAQLDAATNERKMAEWGGNPAIGPGELLYGVPEAHIVNAAFTHPGPHGGRFNSPRRGAWYAAIDLETSVREAGYHKRQFLQDGGIRERITMEYQDFRADFFARFHFLDGSESDACLRPEPIPQCYGPSQALAERLLNAGSNGIVYPSVRHSPGTCVACFRPALVFHPRRGHGYRISVAAGEDAIFCDEISAI